MLGPRISLFLLGAALCPAAVEFNRDIRPILSDRCFACHGNDAGNRKSKLRLDRAEDAKADLGNGRRGIVPGKPSDSAIMQRITSTNRTLRMPPAYLGHEKLSDRDIDLLRRWIEEGAAYQPHWAFLPPKRPAGTIDSLVRSRLAREGLSMSPPADPAALLRRITFDLTGLPPKPEDLAAFLHDPASYERVVDRLLASSAHAERMAIRWLEAARYADTNGYQTDGVRDMYRYRDWVIDAYLRNQPFDQFTIEQIAGDLLPRPSLDQRIATGFHRNHRTSAEGGIIDEEFRVEYVADRAETTATVWLGLTMGCARCHDHKYDPLPQRDFYRMFAFFNNVPEKGFVYNFGNEPPFIKAPTAAQQRRLDALEADLAAARQRVAATEPAARRAFSEWLRAPRNSPDDYVIPAGLVLDRAVTQLPAEWGRDLAQFTNTDPYTIAVRCKPAGPKGAIASRIEDYLDGTGWGLFLLDGKLRVHHVFRHTDLGLRVETKRPVRLNAWQHIAV
nr:DUF1549 domain-containing protein [Bryobacter sp.]